jgi:hypothetical protein
MIEELVTDVSYIDKSRLSCHPPKNALAGTRYKNQAISDGSRKTLENRTIPVGP